MQATEVPPHGQKVTDAKTFWNAIGIRAIGASVVTAQGLEGPTGFLALSVAHLASTPPTMMVGIGKKTSAISAVQNSRHFAINCLAAGQTELIDTFGGRNQIRGQDRFASHRWGTLGTGAPVLLDGVGALDCQLEELIERHDTFIAIGRLTEYVGFSGRKPLVCFAGGYL